jgi:hypothetical protein
MRAAPVFTAGKGVDAFDSRASTSGPANLGTARFLHPHEFGVSMKKFLQFLPWPKTRKRERIPLLAQYLQYVNAHHAPGRGDRF